MIVVVPPLVPSALPTVTVVAPTLPASPISKSSISPVLSVALILIAANSNLSPPPVSPAPIFPSIVTLPAPDTIVKPLAVSVAASTVLVNLTRPSPSEVSIVILSASDTAPVRVTSPFVDVLVTSSV